MSTVGAATQALSAVHLNVIDDQTINIESSVVSIGLSVAQQLQQKLGGLLWPATLCGLPLLGLSATAYTTVEATEWHALLLVDDGLQETLGTTQGHALDGLCGLVRVLQQHRKHKKMNRLIYIAYASKQIDLVRLGRSCWIEHSLIQFLLPLLSFVPRYR